MPTIETAEPKPKKTRRRAKAKEDQVKVKCRSCEFQQTVGSLNELIQGVLTDVKECRNCGKILLHVIRTWETGKWMEGMEFGSSEWQDFIRNETQKGED
jgi:ribosomal protein S27E